MARIADTSKAREYPIHPAGGPFLFAVALVKEVTSKNGDPMLIFELVPADDQPGRCRCSVFALNTPESFMLHRMCRACGLPPEGGYDSEDFVGKVFEAEIVHNPSRTEPGKTYIGFARGTMHPSNQPAPRLDTEDDLPF